MQGEHKLTENNLISYAQCTIIYEKDMSHNSFLTVDNRYKQNSILWFLHFSQLKGCERANIFSQM